MISFPLNQRQTRSYRNPWRLVNQFKSAVTKAQEAIDSVTIAAGDGHLGLAFRMVMKDKW